MHQTPICIMENKMFSLFLLRIGIFNVVQGSESGDPFQEGGVFQFLGELRYVSIWRTDSPRSNKCYLGENCGLVGAKTQSQ